MGPMECAYRNFRRTWMKWAGGVSPLPAWALKNAAQNRRGATRVLMTKDCGEVGYRFTEATSDVRPFVTSAAGA